MKAVKISVVILSVLLVVLYKIDARPIHPYFEPVVSYENKSNVGIQWIVYKDGGFSSKEALWDELMSTIGFIPNDIDKDPGYSYIAVYGGTLVDMEYPENAISNWVLLKSYNKDYYNVSYGNIVVKADRSDIVHLYRFKNCPFEQDIHSNRPRPKLIE